MAFCIPRQHYDQVKEAFKKQNVNVSDLYGMSSKERRGFFKEMTNEDLGKFINTEFETAIAKAERTGKADAIEEWVTSLLDPKLKRKGVTDDITKKIRKMEEIGALDDQNALEDLVAKTLGADLTVNETKKIIKLSDEMEVAAKKLGDNFENMGNPDHIDKNVDYWVSRKNMDDYLEEITPANKLEVLTSTIRRGGMLWRVSTNTLNVLSNVINGTFVGATKRLSRLGLSGAQKGLRSKYFKMANKIYNKSGYDITRMIDINDGRKILGEDVVHSQGEGAVRKAGRFFDKTIFKFLGTADVAASSMQFQDTVGLAVKKAGRASGLKGEALDKFEKDLMLDIFKGDSITISPKADAIRQLAIADAQRATFTETSQASKFSMSARNLLDDATGDFKLGTQVLPFAKTPANVAAQQLENAGLGAFTGSIDVFKGIKAGNKELAQKGIDKLVRAGVSLTFATMLVNSIEVDDFMGAYEPGRSEEAKLKNSNYNAIRIGDKWISLDYFGPFGATITGMLYAKKYKNKPPQEAIKSYITGASNQLAQIPGAEELGSVLDTSLGVFQGDAQAIKKAKSAPGNYLLSYTPGILVDLSKATDEFQRDTRDDSMLRAARNRLYASIPGMSQKLDPKMTAFGEEVRTEFGESGIWGGIGQMIFGSRVKTTTPSREAEEVFRLQGEGFKPRLINLDYLRNQKVVAMKEILSEKEYKEAKAELGKNIEKSIGEMMDTEKYAVAEDDEKKEMMNKVTSKELDKMYKKTGATKVVAQKKKAAKKAKKEREAKPSTGFRDIVSKINSEEFKALPQNNKEDVVKRAVDLMQNDPEFQALTKQQQQQVLNRIKDLS